MSFLRNKLLPGLKLSFTSLSGFEDEGECPAIYTCPNLAEPRLLRRGARRQDTTAVLTSYRVSTLNSLNRSQSFESFESFTSDFDSEVRVPRIDTLIPVCKCVPYQTEDTFSYGYLGTGC